jgi:hypothetical protein
MRRVIDEADIWPPNSVGRRRRRTTRTDRLLRLLRRALPSPDPLDWQALADAASREIAAMSMEGMAAALIKDTLRAPVSLAERRLGEMWVMLSRLLPRLLPRHRPMA